MKINNIMVAGSGVLGSQIAFQSAYYGYEVNVYDINEDVLEKAKERINALIKTYTEYFKDEQKAKEAITRISFYSNLEKSVENIDLVIEAIPEKIDIKKEFYNELGKVSPEKTIFATNTSTLLPSQFAQETGRPEKFSALHFANDIREKNTAEVMGHEGTSDWVINLLLDFAESIGMVALHVKKEHPGYLLNSLLVPFLTAGQGLWANGIADPETIDKTWMIATGAPLGPFAILDIVGIETVYNIVKSQVEADPTKQPILDALEKNFIDKGKFGKSSGEGFYKYPNPKYTDENFLK